MANSTVICSGVCCLCCVVCLIILIVVVFNNCKKKYVESFADVTVPGCDATNTYPGGCVAYKNGTFSSYAKCAQYGGDCCQSGGASMNCISNTYGCCVGKTDNIGEYTYYPPSS